MAASNFLLDCLRTLNRDQAIRSSPIQLQLYVNILQTTNNHT